jgi:hypothetical protein
VPLEVTSGARTTAGQNAIRANPNQRLPVARPETSRHVVDNARNQGQANAVDLNVLSAPGAQGWLASEAQKYGVFAPHKNDPVHFELLGGGRQMTMPGETGGGTNVTGNIGAASAVPKFTPQKPEVVVAAESPIAQAMNSLMTPGAAAKAATSGIPAGEATGVPAGSLGSALGQVSAQSAGQKQGARSPIGMPNELLKMTPFELPEFGAQQQGSGGNLQALLAKLAVGRR